MASIIASQVAYAMQAQRAAGLARVARVFKLTFPTSTTTSYATGGVPLDKARLGCPRNITSLRVLGRSPGPTAENPSYEWNGDSVNPTLVAFETNTAGSPATEFDAATNYTQNGQVVFVEVEGY